MIHVSYVFCFLISFWLLYYLAMTLICVVSALVFPLVFLIEMEPAPRQLIASVSIAAICMVSLGIMFWPKILGVVEGEDLNWSAMKGTSINAK